MDKNFDADKAKQFLENREIEERESRELDRKAVLKVVIESLKTLFSNTDVEIYLVGSITHPNMFYPHSDVDIVLKNFKGDRFDIWTQLEALVKRDVEVIVFENCHFQEYIVKSGYKVL